MAQEFFIKSADLEAKIRQLLPSQGGLGAGQDLTATTQIVPIVDLTETAEGSNVRADLQTAFSHNNSNIVETTNTTNTLITNTGYWRIFGVNSFTGAGVSAIFLVDSAGTAKDIYRNGGLAGYVDNIPFDFNVFLSAGDELRVQTNATTITARVAYRQIADIDGNLIQPT